MTIKEVSEKYGISQDTLRYYERVNVIPKVTRTSHPEEFGITRKKILDGLSLQYV